MFEEQDKGQNYNPIDQANLCCLHPHIVFHIHYFLQLLASFLYLSARVLNVEIDPIEHTSLLDDEV